jgi:hypothetical protein
MGRSLLINLHLGQVITGKMHDTAIAIRRTTLDIYLKLQQYQLRSLKSLFYPKEFL